MSTITFIFIILFVPLALYCFYKWFEIYNGPDGERYRRMKVQGSFAPLTTEDIEQDKQRIAERKAK
jgi:hypothetical protein